jgi:hypothetical protein
MIIPTHFYIDKKKYEIIFDTEECENAEALGLFYEDDREIFLTKIYKGEKQPKKELEKTLLHEITHSILTSMGRPELSADEDLVDGFGNRLHQVLKYLYPNK